MPKTILDSVYPNSFGGLLSATDNALPSATILGTLRVKAGGSRRSSQTAANMARGFQLDPEIVTSTSKAPNQVKWDISPSGLNLTGGYIQSWIRLKTNNNPSNITIAPIGVYDNANQVLMILLLGNGNIGYTANGAWSNNDTGIKWPLHTDVLFCVEWLKTGGTYSIRAWYRLSGSSTRTIIYTANNVASGTPNVAWVGFTDGSGQTVANNWCYSGLQIGSLTSTADFQTEVSGFVDPPPGPWTWYASATGTSSASGTIPSDPWPATKAFLQNEISSCGINGRLNCVAGGGDKLVLDTSAGPISLSGPGGTLTINCPGLAITSPNGLAIGGPGTDNWTATNTRKLTPGAFTLLAGTTNVYTTASNDASCKIYINNNPINRVVGSTLLGSASCINADTGNSVAFASVRAALASNAPADWTDGTTHYLSSLTNPNTLAATGTTIEMSYNLFGSMINITAANVWVERPSLGPCGIAKNDTGDPTDTNYHIQILNAPNARVTGYNGTGQAGKHAIGLILNQASNDQYYLDDLTMPGGTPLASSQPLVISLDGPNTSVYTAVINRLVIRQEPWPTNSPLPQKTVYTVNESVYTHALQAAVMDLICRQWDVSGRVSPSGAVRHFLLTDSTVGGVNTTVSGMTTVFNCNILAALITGGLNAVQVSRCTIKPIECRSSNTGFRQVATRIAIDKTLIDLSNVVNDSNTLGLYVRAGATKMVLSNCDIITKPGTDLALGQAFQAGEIELVNCRFQTGPLGAILYDALGNPVTLAQLEASGDAMGCMSTTGVLPPLADPPGVYSASSGGAAGSRLLLAAGRLDRRWR